VFSECHTKWGRSFRFFVYVGGCVDALSRFYEQVDARLAWFPELQKQSLEVGLVDVINTSTHDSSIKLRNEQGKVKTRYFFFQHVLRQKTSI
jgi:hypothetical protein